MSTEDAPWILALNGVECRICGHSIDLQHAASDPNGPGSWRSYHQDLQFASPPAPGVSQPLVPTEICTMTFHGESRTMHAACWKIVESLWCKSEFTMAELDGFLDVSADRAPFLPEMPHTVSPIEIDTGLTSAGPRTSQQNSTTTPATQNLFTTLEDEELQKPLLPEMRNYALPSELERHVHRWLTTTEADDEESQADPTLGYWSSVARMLENHPHFSGVSPEKVAEDLTRFLQNLHNAGLNSFPHLANYDIAHANAMTILLTLLKLPLEDISGAPDQNGQRAKLQQTKNVNLPPALDTPALLRFHLSTLRRRSHAEGTIDRNLRVGVKYLRDVWFGPPGADIIVKPEDVVLEVPSFAGLRFIRDQLGVFAVDVKQGETWHSAWRQNEGESWQEGMEGTASTAVEWQSGAGEPSFLIASNTYLEMMLLDNAPKRKIASKRNKLKRMFKMF